MLQALIFDFDGLILETESPDFEAWQKIYAEFGLELKLETWLKVVGSAFTPDLFDPMSDLASHLGEKFDRDDIQTKHDFYENDIIHALPIMPGVEQLIEAASARGLKLAVGSSSPRSWVAGHLERLGMLDKFDVITTADDVSRVKPAPDIFQAAAFSLGVAPNRAVVFEDSRNGVTAARGAGIFVVAVPNELTRHADLSHADMQVSSLEEVDLDQLSSILNRLNA